MLIHELFYAKTFVAQATGYKRFRIEGMYYSAIDTLNHAYDDKIITRADWNEADEHVQTLLYEWGAIMMFVFL